jgi:hypothetical protein
MPSADGRRCAYPVQSAPGGICGVELTSRGRWRYCVQHADLAYKVRPYRNEAEVVRRWRERHPFLRGVTARLYRMRRGSAELRAVPVEFERLIGVWGNVNKLAGTPLWPEEWSHWQIRGDTMFWNILGETLARAHAIGLPVNYLRELGMPKRLLRLYYPNPDVAELFEAHEFHHCLYPVGRAVENNRFPARRYGVCGRPTVRGYGRIWCPTHGHRIRRNSEEHEAAGVEAKDFLAVQVMVDLSSILAGYGIKAAGQGSRAAVPCPFHLRGRSASFRVDTKKNTWHCWDCGACGGPVELVARLEGIRLRAAARRLARDLLSKYEDDQ